MSDWNPRASDWTSKPFGFGSQPEARDVTFKIKYGDTLKRFYGAANGMTLDINLSALRAKIANAFKFGPDAEFILTYTDEDGDAVMLDDDDDLLMPLNNSRVTESVKPTAQDPVSQIMSAIEALKPISKSSTAPEECLAQIKSAVGEAIKSIPEPIPDALAKLSHEVLDSAPPPFAELIKPLVQVDYTKREDFDLCDSCFKRMGNEAEYSKIDKPVVHRLSRDPNVLIWVGGDHFALQTSVPLEVEDPSFVNGKNKSAINLNLPPESNSSNMNLIDANMEPFTSTQGYNSYPVDMSHTFEPKKSQPAPFAFEPQKSQPAPFTFIIPDVADVPLSTTPVTAVSPSASVPTSEPVLSAVPLPVSMPNMTETSPDANRPASPATSVEVLAPVSVSASVSDAAAPEPGIDGDTEEKLLKELEEMGFKQVDLNKEILRQNNYNLEQSVDDLCGVNEWDPLLAELEEMGFDDTEMNKELLAKNGGSIKRAVMDLIAREKKDK
ncbi:hypothetical protein PR202_gb08950 [Eleusine coracana subsp. coracana]|uniref:PB1 domain-containing protein n=1 Tax=Eleusine coracana subsp. coracana TaxID=191504 RepID=A0AAV5EFY3_ELECO|nr:hypothetical protein PR202_gb08950 [Eleusine coracana subsp. coracana]